MRLKMLMFVAVPLAFALSAADSVIATSTLVQATPSGKTPGFDVSALDRNVDPCADFYQFACGGWIAKTPIPPDQARWGRFNELSERNEMTLRDILQAATTAPGTSDANTRKIGDYYASCMDEKTIEAKGTQPLDEEMARIAKLTTSEDLIDEIAHLHTLGIGAAFRFGSIPDYKDAKSVIAGVDQGGLSLPDRDYYVKDDPKSAEIRTAYVAHVQKMLQLAGSKPEAAATDADRIMELETALAKLSMDRVSRRDPTKRYHKLSAQDLQALTPTVQWNRYLVVVGAPSIASLNVANPDFIKGMDQLLGTTPVDAWKAYFRWHVLHANATLLPAEYHKEHFKFFDQMLTGAREMKPRWKQCVQATDADLGEALGQAFVKQTFGQEGKERTLRMVRALEAALERDIQALDWMSDATKQQALVKLHAIANKIGYPDRWRDYSTLRIARQDAVGNSLRSNTFEFRRDLAKIGKPLDRSEWGMTPPTVNAYYSPLENNINFPAGILQPPFFDRDADDAINFGGIGAVIGHELTHGFDDQGRQFDRGGNLQDWWTPEDARKFEEGAACFVDEYANFTAVDDVKLNGKLTLGENTADNGGVRIAYMALMDTLAGKEPAPIDGFTAPQRLFLGWGQIWCQNARPEMSRLLATVDPHSPGRYRVNGVVANMPEFHKAFGCKADAPMVRQKMCRVW